MGKIDTVLQEAYVLQRWHGEWVAMHVGELGQALPSLLLFIPSLLPASLPFCLSSVLPSISLSSPFHTSSFYMYLHVYLPFSPLLISPCLFSSPPFSLCMCTYARVSVPCPRPRRTRCVSDTTQVKQEWNWSLFQRRVRNTTQHSNRLEFYSSIAGVA